LLGWGGGGSGLTNPRYSRDANSGHSKFWQGYPSDLSF